MLWIFVTITAFLFNAISNVINKILLTTSLPAPFAYTFAVSILQSFAFLLLPFGFEIPNGYELIISFISGFTFTVSLLFLFLAFTVDEAAKVLTITGGLQPIFVFLLAYFFVGERLLSIEMLAFLLLIIGTVIISHEKPSKRKKKHAHLGVIYACIAAIFFAISFSATKVVFQEMDFISGFILTRGGAVVSAFLLLFLSQTRKEVFKPKKKVKSSSKFAFLGNQVLGAISFTLLFYAISLASVTLVTAFNGVQYAFTFLLVILLYKRYPTLLDRPLTKAMILQKSLAILLIIIGIALLAFNSTELLV